MKVYLGGNTQWIQAKVGMSPVCLRARTNGNVVCYITMRAHSGFQNILVIKEAFVWEGRFSLLGQVDRRWEVLH